MSNNVFEQIDKALSRYYTSLGQFNYTNDGGIGKFLEFCHENEADPDDIDDELGDFENCILLEFDENFPFDEQYQNQDQNTKQKFIFNLLKRCHENPNITFNFKKSKTLNTDDFKQPSLARKKTVITDSKLLATCAAISRYYKSINKPYNQLFSIYCHDNGLDLVEELKQEVHECDIINFDENFPFGRQLLTASENLQHQFLFDLIKDCYNTPNRMFNPHIPQCLLSTSTLQYLFTITVKEYYETKRLYIKQCPTLWNSGMELDKGFTYAISIGRKYSFDYLQYLVDDYHRSRIRNIDNSYSVDKWSLKHPHFMKLKTIKFNPPWKKEEEKTQKEVAKQFKSKGKKQPNRGPQNAYDIAVGAIKSYEVRCIPKLQFKGLRSINDSLEIITRYIDAVVGFVRGRIDESFRRQMPVCPFQIDFCIGFGEPMLKESFVPINNDDDDDDDDVDENKKNETDADEFVDVINEIEKKLMRNGLKYYQGEQTPKQVLDFEFMTKRGLSTIYERFVQKHNLGQDKGLKKSPEIYLHNKRLIIFVDRRHKTGKQQDTGKDDIWIYEPPKNCVNIPTDAVPEWHISASKTCLLPNMTYGDGKEAEHQGMIEDARNDQQNIKDKKKSDGKKIEKIQKSNISSSSHCKGALMTLSFIAKEADSIKCYLYWNGQMTRFMPEDCKTVLPEIFNMKWNNGSALLDDDESFNENFLTFEDENEIERNDIDAIIKRMKQNMRDVYFDNNICLRRM